MLGSAESPLQEPQSSANCEQGTDTQLQAQAPASLQLSKQYAVRQDALIDEALASACGILAEVMPDSDQNCRRHTAAAPFLSRAHALIFYQAVKTGLGLAVEHGTGIVVARLDDPLDTAANGSASEEPASPWPTRWSAPCFVRVEGVSWGLVAGIDRVRGVIGLLSKEAVDRLAQGSFRVTAGTECNWALGHGGSANRDMLANADIAQVTIAKGVMIDICVKAGLVLVDNDKNHEVYGHGVCAENLLSGQIDTPVGVQVLASAIRGAEGQELVEAFEPSVHGSDG